MSGFWGVSDLLEPVVVEATAVFSVNVGKCQTYDLGDVWGCGIWERWYIALVICSRCGGCI